MTYRLLDLFSGIGGFSLGLERSGGFRTVAFCEIDPFCRKVLRKHWPDVPIYEDVCSLTAEQLASDGIAVDAVCGGFPCQDISAAGRRVGINGKRSGLWSEFARIIGEVRPEYVIVENVAALLGRGLDKVLGDLAAVGFDAEWHCIPAAAVGAPHIRDRLWIIAYSNRIGRPRKGVHLVPELLVCDRSQWTAAPFSGWRHVVDWLESANARDLWAPTHRESGGMDDGPSKRLDRPDISASGNAVLPQIPELIGRAILEVA